MVRPSDHDQGSASDAAGPPEVEWVSLSEAASMTGCTEFWLIDRCRDGRLPSRTVAGGGLAVPLATVRALVAGNISE
jgi:hypothetical protein